MNGIYVDDEGLFVEDQLFFTYHGDNYSQTLGGNGLILGVDSEGNSISPTITVKEVEEAVGIPAEASAIRDAVRKMMKDHSNDTDLGAAVRKKFAK